jgi:hypothetical protein
VNPKLSTLDAHIQLDAMAACHQRLRELLKTTQEGGYTKSAFIQSCREIFTELFLLEIEESFGRVAEQLFD